MDTKPPANPRASLPQFITSVAHLEDLLSEPSPGAIETVGRLKGDFIVLGVGGKMGPTLSRMIRRAVEAAGTNARVIGVSRFSSPELPAQLRDNGIEPISCDLLDTAAVSRLPDAANVIYMAGMKFGTTGQQSRTWAMNAWLPGVVAQRFRASRIVAFSTGNVYPMTDVRVGGATEDHEPSPTGEYAMSCLGRERIFEHFSRTLSIPMAIIRLNYAVEMRYGVVVDLAQRIMHDEPIDLAMGNFNAIWQADANAMTIQSFDHVATPPWVVNVTGPETLSVRAICTRLAERMTRPVRFVGTESATALLANSQRAATQFGYPRVTPAQFIDWAADWVSQGRETLGKPTHFEARDGKF